MEGHPLPVPCLRGNDQTLGTAVNLQGVTAPHLLNPLSVEGAVRSRYSNPLKRPKVLGHEVAASDPALCQSLCHAQEGPRLTKPPADVTAITTPIPHLLTNGHEDAGQTKDHIQPVGQGHLNPPTDPLLKGHGLRLLSRGEQSVEAAPLSPAGPNCRWHTAAAQGHTGSSHGHRS